MTTETDDPTLCRQKNCDNIANVRYIWPGQDESYACLICFQKIATINQAMSGPPLYERLLTTDDYLRMMK